MTYQEDATTSDAPSYRTTDFTARRLGDAIVLDLTAAIPPPKRELPAVHMTLLFRRGGFSTEELARVQDCIATAVAADHLVFQLLPWGRASDLVVGPLASLCVQVQVHFDGDLHDMTAARPPHVALRAVSRY